MAVYFLHNKSRSRGYYNLDVRNKNGSQRRVKPKQLPWGMKQVCSKISFYNFELCFQYAKIDFFVTNCIIEFLTNYTNLIKYLIVRSRSFKRLFWFEAQLMNWLFICCNFEIQLTDNLNLMKRIQLLMSEIYVFSIRAFKSNMQNTNISRNRKLFIKNFNNFIFIFIYNLKLLCIYLNFIFKKFVNYLHVL